MQLEQASLEFNYTEVILHEKSDKDNEMYEKLKKIIEEDAKRQPNITASNNTSNDTNGSPFPENISDILTNNTHNN